MKSKVFKKCLFGIKLFPVSSIKYIFNQYDVCLPTATYSFQWCVSMVSDAHLNTPLIPNNDDLIGH